jgi:hypothetical protein
MSDRGSRWYRDPPVVISMIVGVLAIIAGLGALARGCAEPPPALSVVYIVDRSAGMDGSIGGKNKLAAVKAEILGQVRDRPNVATALRLTGGGDCSSGYEPPTVYHEDNAEAFASALAGVRAQGPSDFAKGLARAVNDMLGDDAAAQSTSRTIFVAVGGVDTCARDQAIPIIDGALRDLRARRQVDMTFKFVGVKPPRAVKRLLERVRGRVDALGFTAETVIADTPQELADALPDLPSPRDEAYDGE